MVRLLKNSSVALVGLLLLLSVPGGANAAGDAGRGKAVFTAQCSACHSPKPNQTILGPSLFGVAGRMSGTVKGYAYTPQMKATHWLWTDEKLRAYVPAPQVMVPGSRMVYPGLKVPSQIDDLIAYLHTLK